MALLAQGHDFLMVGMTLEEGIAKTYKDNDMVLVSYVRAACAGSPGAVEFDPDLRRACPVQDSLQSSLCRLEDFALPKRTCQEAG